MIEYKYKIIQLKILISLKYANLKGTNMSNIILTRKYKIIPIDKDGKTDEEFYSFFKQSTYAQYLALNRAISFIATTYYNNKQDFTSENYKKTLKELMFNKTDPLFADIEFGKGIDTLSLVGQKVKSDFSTAIKNGLANGDRSIPNYKRTCPLLTRGRNLRFYYDDKGNVLIKWINGITFKVIIGRGDKDFKEVVQTLNKIISGEFLVGGSQIIKDDKNLVLAVSLNMGEKKPIDIDKSIVMGIDLGIAVPAFASLENNPNVRKGFGSGKEFFELRVQMRDRRHRLSKQLAYAKGGKGRKDKLSKLKKLKENERNWVHTYNHQLSKKIVDFAIQNRVGTIKMEALTKEGFSDRLLGIWSYYELQSMIDYKASLVGMDVLYVEPAYTSQTCSCCGHISEENRISQAEFICVQCGFKINADWNASINIGRAEPIVPEEKKKVKKSKKNKKKTKETEPQLDTAS